VNVGMNIPATISRDREVMQVRGFGGCGIVQGKLCQINEKAMMVSTIAFNLAQPNQKKPFQAAVKCFYLKVDEFSFQVELSFK